MAKLLKLLLSFHFPGKFRQTYWGREFKKKKKKLSVNLVTYKNVPLEINVNYILIFIFTCYFFIWMDVREAAIASELEHTL